MLPAGEVFFTALWLLLPAEAAGHGVPLQVIPLGPTEAAPHMPGIHLPPCMASQVMFRIWAAQYSTRLPVELKPKDVDFSFLVSFLMFRFDTGCGGCSGETSIICLLVGSWLDLWPRHVNNHMKLSVLRRTSC